MSAGAPLFTSVTSLNVRPDTVAHQLIALEMLVRPKPGWILLVKLYGPLVPPGVTEPLVLPKSTKL